MPRPQLLHIVVGGELTAVGSLEFRDLAKLDLVGAYGSYDEALAAWRERAQATVDNALVRYFIIHAHKLLDPASDDGVAPS